MPLLEECMKREKEVKDVTNFATQVQRSLKILFSMIKSPKLCDMFFKAERKRFTEAQIEKIHEQSILVLR